MLYGFQMRGLARMHCIHSPLKMLMHTSLSTQMRLCTNQKNETRMHFLTPHSWIHILNSCIKNIRWTRACRPMPVRTLVSFCLSFGRFYLCTHFSFSSLGFFQYIKQIRWIVNKKHADRMETKCQFSMCMRVRMCCVSVCTLIIVHTHRRIVYTHTMHVFGFRKAHSSHMSCSDLGVCACVQYIYAYIRTASGATC